MAEDKIIKTAAGAITIVSDESVPLGEFRLSTEHQRIHELHAEVERLRDIVRKQNDEIERLQAVVADQALTIGVLKDELEATTEALSHERDCSAGLADDVVRAEKEAQTSRLALDVALKEVEQVRKLLDDERSLTAATAAHTTALERKVAELTEAAEDCLKRLERCHDEADKYQVRALKAEAESERLRKDAIDPLYQAALADRERLSAENAALKENASATLYHESLRMKRKLKRVSWAVEEGRRILSDRADIPLEARALADGALAGVMQLLSEPGATP